MVESNADGFMTVAKVGAIPEGEGRSFQVGERLVAVFLQGGRYFAIDDLCPHMGASLAEGEIDGDQVICPWHAAHFSVKTGEALSPPADQDVTRFNVRAEGDTIEIEV